MYVGTLEAKEGVLSPETGVTECCEVLCLLLGVEPRSLEEQLILLA